MMLSHWLKLIREVEDYLNLLMKMHDDENRKIFARFIRNQLDRLRKEIELELNREHRKTVTYGPLDGSGFAGTERAGARAAERED